MSTASLMKRVRRLEQSDRFTSIGERVQRAGERLASPADMAAYCAEMREWARGILQAPTDATEFERRLARAEWRANA